MVNVGARGFLLIVLLVSVGFAVPPASATALDSHFLVPADAGCTTTAVATDADCWSHTQGGAGGAGVPGTGNFETSVGSGTATVTQDAAMILRAFTQTVPPSVITWNTGGFALTARNNLVVAGGTFNAGASTITIGGNDFPLGGSLSIQSAFIFNAQSSTINLNSDGTGGLTGMDFQFCTTCAFNAGTSTINFNGDGADSEQTYDEGTGDFTLNIVTVAAGNTLTADPMTFTSLDVNGDYIVGAGPTASSFQINRGGAVGTIGIPSWTTYNAVTPDIQWTMDSSVAAMEIVFEFSGLPSNRYVLLRNGNTIATDTDGDGTASFTFTGGWGTGDVMRILKQPPGGEGGDIPDTQLAGGYGTFANLFDVKYPDPGKRCQNVTIEDTRSIAALAVLYVWNFGDGTQEETAKGSVGHVYKEEGLYTVTVRVQYRTGAIEIFLVNVNARGDECLFSEFVHDFFPLLLALIALMAIAAAIVQASKRRIEKRLRKLLIRLFLSVALIAFGIVAVVVIYTTGMNIPI